MDEKFKCNNPIEFGDDEREEYCNNCKKKQKGSFDINFKGKHIWTCLICHKSFERSY